MVAPDGCYEKAFITAAGTDAVNGLAYVTFGGVDPAKLTGPGKKFVDGYKARYGNTPEAYAIYGYECGKVVMEAIKKVGKKDRDAIREAGVATKDFDQGALGKWSFDANGDTTQANFTVSAVKNGDFAVEKEYSGDDIQKLQKS
jgi:branched-chain amino acid transport system substrate-binding protein